MKISNYQTSLLFTILGAVGKGWGGVREIKMLFSGKTISSTRCTCTLTNLYLVNEAPKIHSKDHLVNCKLMHILTDQGHKAIALFILLYIPFGSPNLFFIILLNKMYNNCNEKSQSVIKIIVKIHLKV